MGNILIYGEHPPFGIDFIFEFVFFLGVVFNFLFVLFFRVVFKFKIFFIFWVDLIFEVIFNFVYAKSLLMLSNVYLHHMTPCNIAHFQPIRDQEIISLIQNLLLNFFLTDTTQHSHILVLLRYTKINLNIEWTAEKWKIESKVCKNKQAQKLFYTIYSKNSQLRKSRIWKTKIKKKK